MTAAVCKATSDKAASGKAGFYAGLLSVFLIPLVTVAVISMDELRNVYSGGKVAAVLDMAQRKTLAFVADLEREALVSVAGQGGARGGSHGPVDTVTKIPVSDVSPAGGGTAQGYQYAGQMENGAWCINIASMADSHSASSYVEYIRARGIDAQLRHITLNDHQYWRIYVKGFHSIEEAESAAMVIKDRLGLKEVWIRHEPDHSGSFDASA